MPFSKAPPPPTMQPCLTVLHDMSRTMQQHLSMSRQERSPRPTCCRYRALEDVGLARSTAPSRGSSKPSDNTPTLHSTWMSPAESASKSLCRSSCGMLPSRCAAGTSALWGQGRKGMHTCAARNLASTHSQQKPGLASGCGPHPRKRQQCAGQLRALASFPQLRQGTQPGKATDSGQRVHSQAGAAKGLWLAASLAYGAQRVFGPSSMEARPGPP